jgi:hypothetical protein
MRTIMRTNQTTLALPDVNFDTLLLDDEFDVFEPIVDTKADEDWEEMTYFLGTDIEE